MKKNRLLVSLVVLILSVSACTNKNIEHNDGTEEINTAINEDFPEQIQEELSTSESDPIIPYVQPEMKGEISVNIYESSEWLTTAAQMFTEKYPDMKVNIHDFYNGTDIYIHTGDGVTTTGVRPVGQTREDYIAQLNTQILSKEADDIMITSIGLPIGRYIQMGVFEDLSFYLEQTEEINESNYYMNIFDACRTPEGALYQFPISAMAIPTVKFDSALMEHTGISPAPGTEAITWREALDLGKQMYDASSLPNTFMNSARNIVSDVFTKSTIASIHYDTGKVEIDRDNMLDILSVFEEMEDYKSVPSDFNYNNELHVPYGIHYRSDVETAIDMQHYEDMVLQWKYDDGKVYLSPYFALDFGISSQSKNKELAWEFLKFLVSDEVQTLPSCPYAGVNKNGLKARVEGYVSTSGSSQEMLQSVTDIVDGWITQINGYRSEDTELIQIAEGTLAEYMDGSATAEETIDNLIRRLEQYMNE